MENHQRRSRRGGGANQDDVIAQVANDVDDGDAVMQLALPPDLNSQSSTPLALPSPGTMQAGTQRAFPFPLQSYHLDGLKNAFWPGRTQIVKFHSGEVKLKA